MEHLVEHAIRKHRQRFLEARLRGIGLSTPQGFYLMKVSEHEQIKLNQLIEASPFHKSHITRQIQHLSSLGLVEKVVDPVDSRGLIISITPEGLKQVEQVKQALSDWENLCHEALTSEEQEALHSIQEKILRHIEMTFGEDDQID